MDRRTFNKMLALGWVQEYANNDASSRGGSHCAAAGSLSTGIGKIIPCPRLEAHSLAKETAVFGVFRSNPLRSSTGRSWNIYNLERIWLGWHSVK